MLNIGLAFLKIIPPLFSMIALQINLAQDGALKGIIKNYAMQALLSNVDDLMAKTLPDVVHSNQKEINANK